METTAEQEREINVDYEANPSHCCAGIWIIGQDKRNAFRGHVSVAKA